MKPQTLPSPVCASVNEAIAACLTTLAAYAEAPDSSDAWQALRQSRADVARQLVALSDQPTVAAALKPALELQLKLAASGALDHEVDPADLELAVELASQGATGLLAAMMLVSAWQWPDAPSYATVPETLRSAYTAWLFLVPQGFCAVGQVEAYAAHYLRRLEEFSTLVESQPTTKSVRAALAVFATTNNSIPLYFTAGSLRRHMELRGRLLAAWGVVDRAGSPAPRSRTGRRLRVGFINRHFCSQTETYTTLPTFEQLDPARFEVQLFAHHNRDTDLEKYARSRAESFTLLPEKLEEQLKVLRAAELDVVVFGTNVTAVCHEVTRLALHRIAPLQVVNNSSCTTTGLAEIDLYVSGTATETVDAPAHFTERLGLVRGPAHAFNYVADRQPPSRTWSRADLGLSEKTMLFVSAANFYKITPEMRELWARLLAAVPGARLLLHPFNPNWSSHYPIKRFCAEFDRVLEAHGVASERLIVSSVRFPSRTDVGELLKLGDVYLDTHPFAGVNSLVDPLEHGVPVVTCEGGTFRSRMGAALLRNLGLDELIVRDDEAYLALCTELAYEREARDALRARILAAMERSPLFLDTLAASDAFGALLEQAHDELCARGRDGFRRAAEPIVAPEVAAPALRHARGRELLAAGDPTRASDYFLAAIQHDERNAALWRDLADALRRTNRIEEAVHCLQTSLQLAPRETETWQLLADLSHTLGHAELHAEAAAMITKLSETVLATGEVRQRMLVYTDDPDAGGVAQYNHSIMV
ncbi:MAG TPA: tetratricopeptide repeat protein, partial [Lacunisphaera sp.]